MTVLKKQALNKKNIVIVVVIISVLAIIGIIINIILSQSGKRDSVTTTKNVDSSKTTSTKQKSQTLKINGITLTGAPNCTIPDKVLMSDFLGYSLTTIVAKYGGVSQLHPEYTSQVITCENDNYFIRINSTKTNQIADYIEIQEKEFGTCDAGIDNVLPWVDKSMRAVGLDPGTKGSATYDTEDYRSQVEYNNYTIGQYKTYLTVECNITGDYIGVLAVLAEQQ